MADQPVQVRPSPLAERIREHLREAHRDCGCALGALWAEDIQEILDLAAQEAS